jgi:hypothetical protein
MPTVGLQEMCATVSSRLLSGAERPYCSGDSKIPLVIEPKPGSQNVGSLCEFLSTNSESVVESIYQHGAVLLRGFDITDDQEFARVTRSIKGLHPMNGYFGEEHGRVPIKGSTTLFHTNRYVKTGGSFKKIGGFHGENYHSTDVPAFQSLWCRLEPRVGGETALIQAADVYDDLDAPLREKLEREPFDTDAVPLPVIARRYAITESVAESVCTDVGLPIEEQNGCKFAIVRKPSVFRHPYTKRCSLQVSPSFMLPAFDAEVRKHLEPHYRSLGWKWTLHRWGWSSPMAYRLLMKLESFGFVASDPLVLWARLNDPRDRLHVKFQTLLGKHAKPEPRFNYVNRVGRVLNSDDIAQLARAFAKHLTVFTWKRGDILIWDNITLNHGGMPGMGHRSLIATLYEAVPLNFASFRSGVADIPFPDPSHEPLTSRFSRIGAQN